MLRTMLWAPDGRRRGEVWSNDRTTPPPTTAAINPIHTHTHTVGIHVLHYNRVANFARRLWQTFTLRLLSPGTVSISIGSALMNIVGVYKDIQDQHMNIVSIRRSTNPLLLPVALKRMTSCTNMFAFVCAFRFNFV